MWLLIFFLNFQYKNFWVLKCIYFTYYVPSITICEYILLSTKRALEHLFRNAIAGTVMLIHNIIFNENLVKI